jgi:hypothetical protein
VENTRRAIGFKKIRLRPSIPVRKPLSVIANIQTKARVMSRHPRRFIWNKRRYAALFRRIAGTAIRGAGARR